MVEGATFVHHALVPSRSDRIPRMDFDPLLKVLRALHLERVDYILVGGVALGLHGLIRATEGVD